MFPNARVMNGYGTTEAGPAVFGAASRGQVARPKLSLGYPVPQRASGSSSAGPTPDEGVL